MHGDFSRLRFDPLDRFSAVVALQGRVSMESDANEHTAIVQDYLHTLVRDLLGKHGWTDHESFKVTLVGSPEIEDIRVSPGHCYVDGLLVRNDGRDGADTTLYQQPDAFFDRETHPLAGPPFFVYLEVWERLVTAVEEPRIRDVALGAGGPDSSARTKVVWQLKAGESLDGPGLPTTKDEALQYWFEHVEAKLLGADPPPSGRLRARVQPAEDDELCALFPDAGYHGLENQLYRVEIHRGGVLADDSDQLPTFVWSRDNGSVVFPIVSRAGEAVTVSTLGRDDRYSLAPGQWVELVDDATVLNGDPPGDLRRVLHVDPIERRVTLDADASDVPPHDATRHPFLRRWDQSPPTNQLASDNAIPLRGGWFPLEDGIEVGFLDGTYRTGDYWVFPARVETGGIDWYPDLSARPPDGVARRFVPLAYVTSATSDPVDLRTFAAAGTAPQDERVVTLAPAFASIGADGWDLTSTVAAKEAGPPNAAGILSVDLPHGALITHFRAVGKRTGAGGSLDVSLQRAPLQPGVTPETIAHVSVPHVPVDPPMFDTPVDVPEAPPAHVDSHAFKYFVIAQISSAPAADVEISAVQISYVPA